LEALDSGQASGIGVGGLEIHGLKIRIVGEDVRFRGIAAEELEEELDRIAESADTRLTVADIRGNRDSLEKLFRGHGGMVGFFDGVPRKKSGEGNEKLGTFQSICWMGFVFAGALKSSPQRR
jgi:hypothetical protein